MEFCVAHMVRLLTSAFKAKCLALIENLRKIKAISFGRRQIPVPEGIFALSPVARSAWIGPMSDSIEILDDIISPANEESEWEARRD